MVRHALFVPQLNVKEAREKFFNVCKWQWCWLIIRVPSALFFFIISRCCFRMYWGNKRGINKQGRFEYSLKMREYMQRRGCDDDDVDDDEFGIYVSGIRGESKDKAEKSPLLWFGFGCCCLVMLHISLYLSRFCIIVWVCLYSQFIKEISSLMREHQTREYFTFMSTTFESMPEKQRNSFIRCRANRASEFPLFFAILWKKNRSRVTTNDRQHNSTGVKRTEN